MTAPLNYFMHSAGPAAHTVKHLGWVFGGICVFVCILIVVLLAIAIFRRRNNDANTYVERSGDAMKWIYIGTGLSTLILFLMTGYALNVLNNVGTMPSSPALTITVIGYQWWWEAVYDSGDPARQFVTANEIHIPTGQPVLIKLKSADVIHAFWVPQLAGKTQMIPGLINQQWLQADRPGTYWGQCTQYCGTQHAHMAFEVIAQNPDDFALWEGNQRKPATVSATGKGAMIFEQKCAGCHAVRGTSYMGGHAPDLTHLMSRGMIAAGLLENNADNLSKWVAHAQVLKPDVRMPDFDLKPDDQKALISYLTSLQ